ncbi:MAG TPA: 7-cyano-7-deazaguanine synthase QueC [Gemmatimonadaceae bacterium]|nr:7-cyano-7-deazaguanine synthase QueC [Gemmatimonadaceae bacterium]
MSGGTTPRAGARGPAVVLLSGGLDSTTVLALAVRDGWTVHALSFRYGQRHAIEVDRARAIAARYGAARHVVADIDLRVFGGSALTDAIPVPRDRTTAGMGASVPVTYVPARNTIFLAYALALAEVTGAADLFIGVNALDYSGYPDCRPAFIEAFEALANLATRAGTEGGTRFTVHAPLMRMRKGEIIALGTSLGVDYGATVSCYDPSPEGAACGRCDSCQLRREGFAAARIPDPTRYARVGDRGA